MNLTAKDLDQLDELRARGGVQNKPELTLRRRAKYPQNETMELGTICSLPAPQAVEPMPGVFQCWAYDQQVQQVTLHIQAGVCLAVSTSVA